MLAEAYISNYRALEHLSIDYLLMICMQLKMPYGCLTYL